jgi:integrase/recombinase XerD
MKLKEAVTTYVMFKRSLGLRFYFDAFRLRAFCREMGDIDIRAVRPAAVLAFIMGAGPVTAHCRQKFAILRSFYRYALGRGLVLRSPLPKTAPRIPPQLVPYIYSTDELRRLIAATDSLRTAKSRLQALTIRTLLLVLYGTGMRIGEALALNIQDVDMAECILTIRDTKFFKMRLVPVGPTLARKIDQYIRERCALPLPAGEASALFATRTGNRWDYNSVSERFRRVRHVACIQRDTDARYQPRLHDLRHSYTTHRLIAWYRTGADVQRLLPQLSTYLGHKDLASTQRYLTMTADLLQEAGGRFEQYAQPGGRHE